MPDFVGGWDYDIEMDDSGGTVRTFTGYASGVDPTFEQDIHDTPVMGQRSKRVTPGQYGASVSVDGNWHAQVEAWVGAPSTWNVKRTFSGYPEGKTSGNRYWTFEGYIASFNPPFAADDAGKFTLEATADGDVTWGTVA